MRKLITMILLGSVISAMLPVATSAEAETLSGTVVDGSSDPIPGLTVFLVHPVLGRSYPTATDLGGDFDFTNVPLVTDEYYMEIYWGRDLIFRRPVLVRGNTSVG